MAEALTDVGSTDRTDLPELPEFAPRPPGTRGPIRPPELYRRFDFDPDGPDLYAVADKMGIEAVSMLMISAIARASGAMREWTRILPIEDRNNENAVKFAADAFRHGLWSYRLAREFGPSQAKQITDAYERTVVNSIGERAQDLHNNDVGRRLAADQNNHARSDVAVVLDAMRSGDLQLTPLLVADGL